MRDDVVYKTLFTKRCRRINHLFVSLRDVNNCCLKAPFLFTLPLPLLRRPDTFSVIKMLQGGDYGDYGHDTGSKGPAAALQ